MRRFLAWVAVVTALVASKVSAVENHLSGAYDSKRVATSEAPNKSADDKTWLRRESATAAPYSEVATIAPAPATGGSTGAKYEGNVAAVIIPWEARSAKSSGYSTSKAPTAKPERNDNVEGDDVYGATAKPAIDKRNDSQPRDSAVPVQVNEDKGPGWQSTVDDKNDRAWYQRTSAPEPATKTSSPYTDVYGEKTSSPTSDSTSATRDKSSGKSVRNAENDVDRREPEDSRDKTGGHLSLDDQIESSYKTSILRPGGGEASGVYAEKEAAPFDADSSASYAPRGRAMYKWGKDTSASRGDSDKEEFKKDVAEKDYAQTADKVKETRPHHSVSGSLDYNGKTYAPRVEKADFSPSYGEDSADSVDAELSGYRNKNSQTSKTKHVQDGEYDVGIGAKDRGDTDTRDDHQWHERHQHEPAVPEASYDESAGQLPLDGKIKSPHETSETAPYPEKAGPSGSHAAEDPYDEDSSIPSQQHSASSSLEKSSDVYAEKGAAPFTDEETPYGLTGQEKRERGIAAATFPWEKKSSEPGDSKLKSEHHGYHAEGLKEDAAVEKDSKDKMQADQYDEKAKEAHRDDLVPESLDDDKWSDPYKSTGRSAALRQDASTTAVYSEEASRPDKTKVPEEKAPYDDSEDVKRENFPSAATLGEHSNALDNSQYDAEGTSASKAATDGTADEVADADSHKDNDDSESPAYPTTEATPLRLKRGRHIRDGEYASAGNVAKVTEDIDSDPEDQQYSSGSSRNGRRGGWHKSIDGNIEVPLEESTAPVESETTSTLYKEADLRYDGKTSSQTTEQSNAASSETASPPYSEEMTPTYDEKTNPPPSELPSALSEDAPKSPSEQASSEPSSASSGVNHDKGIVWKAEGSKAVTYSSTDAPTSPPEYHEKTQGKSTVYRDALGPVIPWTGGKPQLVREQTNKPKLGSDRTESGVSSDEVAKRASARETRGNSHTVDDVVPWRGGHALFLRGLESEEQPEENKPEEEPAETPVEGPADLPEDKPEEEPTAPLAEEPAELPEDKTPEEKPVETPAEEPAELPEDKTPEEKPVETPAEESAEHPEEKIPEEEPTETPADEPVEPPEEDKPEEEPVETPVDEPVEDAEVQGSDGLMQTTTVSDENVRWDQDDCDPCDVPTLPPTLPPIHPHANDDYTEHLPNVSDVHEAWKELKENAPVPSDASTKPPRKKAPKPCKEDLKHCIKVIGGDGERYECENGYTLTPTEQPTEGPTETPSTEMPTESPTETPTATSTETPSTETPTESPTETPTESPTETPTESPAETPTERPYETPTPATSEPTPAPSQPSEPDEPTPAPSTPSGSEPTPSPTEAYDEPEPTPAASTTEGDNGGGISTRYPTATAASTTVKPAATTEAPSATKTGTTTTSDASAGDTAYATGASSTVGASTSEGNTSSGSSGLDGGAIAGIVIACVVFAAVVVGAVLFKQRAIARQREENLFADLSATGGRALETDYAAM